MAVISRRTQQSRLEEVEGYLLLGMPEQALRAIDVIRDTPFDSLDVCQLRAEVLRELGRHQEALDEFEQADERRPDVLGTLLGMAWCLKRLDRLAEALEAMDRAYRRHPREPIVLYNIACYQSLAGEKQLALSWLGRALRMDPELRQLIADESDFDPLRGDPDFQFVISDPVDSSPQR
jgi:tetratricopeptide (TPR) repeat protein